MQLSPSIFKAYDIRGIIDETLDPSIAKLIGQAFGTEMRELGETDIVIGRDGRLSGPSLIEALTEGLLSTGINVIDLANLDSCSFIATQDLGISWEDGLFDVIGRFDNSDIRGCNLLIQ